MRHILVSQPHGVRKGKEDLENEDEESQRFIIYSKRRLRHYATLRLT